MARVTVDIEPPLGAWRRISSSSSAMAFSATGFLLVFLTRPISRDKPRFLRVGSFRSATKPRAGSTLMMVGGPSRGCRSLHSLASASRSVFAFSLWMIDVAVKDVVVSRTTMIICLHHLGHLRQMKLQRPWVVLPCYAVQLEVGAFSGRYTCDTCRSHERR
jgi:hypothetical protein